MKAMSSTNDPGRLDLWDLPEILSIEAKPVRYESPKRFMVGKAVKDVRECVEVLVKLSAPLPVRALTPTLYIGETPVADYETIGKNQYRFFVLEPSKLQPNAAIAFGWPQMPKELRLASNLRFQIRKNGEA